MTLPRFLGALALVCAATLAHANDLEPIDALANAPMVPQALQRKALPANVERISREERLGLPTFVQLQPSMAKARSAGADPASAARDELKGLASLYGLTAQEADAAVLHHVQTLPGGAQLVRLTSQRDGIEVFREQATVLLNAGGQATAIGGYLGSTALAPATIAKAALAQPLSAPGAVARALQDYGFALGVEQQLQPADAPAGAYQWWVLPADALDATGTDGATLLSARTKPVWFRLPEGLVAATYVELRVRQDGQEHAYAYVVASADGRLLLRHNQTAHADFQYRVFADSTSPYTPWPGAQGRNGTPHPTGTPNGYAVPMVPPSLVTLQNAPFTPNAPWLPAGATQTQGNNVHAYADQAAGDGLNAGDEAECGANLGRDFRACVTTPGVFDHAYDPAQGPLASQGQAAASVVNLFYTTNWLHDWFYDAGFNEAAGNAQADNFGRGGQGGDALRAEALDYSGTNNANMSTPADGAPPRMQMYRFLNRGGVQASANGVTFTQPPAGAQFGPLAFDLTADVVVAAPAKGCTPLTNASSLTNKIALIDRGDCEFSVKVLNAQQAGAAGVVIVNNVASAPTAMGAGTSGASVNIPAIMVAQADSAALAAGGVTLRMQGSGAERSSALDNGIVAHEWGHFISNRLIGDASGLTTNHARGLGEGWGDFHALLLMVRAEDMYAPANSNWSGTYAMAAHAMSTGASLDASDVAYYGMRRYPYSTTMAKNPLTLRHITDGQALPGGAPRNPSAGGLNAEVHNTGEVWAAMLWECYASLLNAHPFQEAQDRMKQYLVAAYKLTPVNPTLIEARDALLAAARANDSADYQRFAAAFVKRGAGALAQVPDRYSATNAGVVENFGTVGVLEIADMRLSLLPADGAQQCDADTVLDSGETGVVHITLRNRGFNSTDSGTVTLSADNAGLSFPDGTTVNVPSVNPGAPITVTARVLLAGLAAPDAGRITAQLAYTNQPTTPADRTLDLPLHRDDIAQRATTDDAEALASAMQFGSTDPAFASAWGAKGSIGSRFYAGATPAAIGSHWMRTPPLQAGAGNLVVTFKHRYRFEKDGATNYDGGQLMISTDNGTTWANAPSAAAGYTGAINGASGSPAEGQQAYVGQSPGWPALAAATVNLGTAYAGLPVSLAWMVHTDPAATTEGWEVDDIAITGITNFPFPRVVADAQTCAPGLVAIDGTPQSATVDTAFPWPLTVRLRGVAGAPQAGGTVTFTVPSSGASAVLAASTVVTDTNGLVVVPATANGEVGSYTVTASTGSYTASFTLANTAVPAAAGLTAVSGTPQSVQVGTAFAQPLRVRLLDVNNAPMAGVSVGFSAPAAGASATLSAPAVLTDANGEAAATATANGTAGSYSVTASVGSVAASFSLTNTAAPVVAGALAAVSGIPQSAPVGTAFAQPLRVRLLDVNSAPMAGVSIGFAVPGTGASATLSASAAVTDAYGEATITVAANGTVGSYTVTATHAGFTAGFALRNTTAPVGSGGGGSPLVISGPAPGGQGIVTATVQNPPANAYFSQSTFADEAGAGVPPLTGYRFPYGLTGFALENVGQGGTVTLRIQYPGPVPAGAEYWKYGRTTPAGAPHWHQIPMVLVNAGTIEITLTDGSTGDTDAQADGTITDPGGLRVLAAVAPGPGGAAPIPALSPLALVLLTAGLGVLGWRRRFMR